jgi:hypothetical protein
MRRISIAIATVVALVGNAAAQAPSSYSLWEFGTMPRPAFKRVLLGNPAVHEELKLTEAQKKGIEDAWTGRSPRLQKARAEAAEKKAQLTRDVAFRESLAAALEALEPGQRDRLDQIQLQSQGPLAFGPRNLQLSWEGPALAQRLRLSDDQVKRIQTIVEEGDKEIEKAATVPIALDPKGGPPTVESIRKWVETAEFKATKRKTRESARKAWGSVIQRIEQVLTGPQRKAYRELLGEPFDLWKIRFSDDETSEDADMVASALNVGGGGGQQADPTFDTKVARPSYPKDHPRVLFDEAHSNFHTADGRYKPFAEMIAHDGYEVIPNKQKFTRQVLEKGRILIIANALGDGENSAFTEAECDAVRDWVRAGGSLLLITDHSPFGGAAESLAKRFGVDMSKGYTSDPANSEGGDTFLVFTRKNNLLGDHPITRGRDDSERINRVQTFTGQSLKGPAGSVTILKLGETAVDQGDDEKLIPAAGRAQGVAFAFGEGRVVVLGEAAELSAQMAGSQKFGMNVPGLDNRQMALNIMHWLSGMLEPRSLPKKAG